jgi:hypothetical protein
MIQYLFIYEHSYLPNKMLIPFLKNLSIFLPNRRFITGPTQFRKWLFYCSLMEHKLFSRISFLYNLSSYNVYPNQHF